MRADASATGRISRTRHEAVLSSATGCDLRGPTPSCALYTRDFAEEKVLFVSGKACSSVSIETEFSFVRKHVF